MGNKSNKLTSRQKRAIAALISCPDKKAAAEMAGVGYTSINRWLRENDLFIAELRRAESEVISGAVRVLIKEQPRNIEVMKVIRDNPRAPVSVRLRAASLLDQSLFKWHEVVNIEQRLSALEKAVNNGK